MRMAANLLHLLQARLEPEPMRATLARHVRQHDAAMAARLFHLLRED
jgi:hypothetical protein